jgi:hypothetical protein
VNVVLEMRSSSNRLDRARKLGQEPVAGVLDNTASVPAIAGSIASALRAFRRECVASSSSCISRE